MAHNGIPFRGRFYQSYLGLRSALLALALTLTGFAGCKQSSPAANSDLSTPATSRRETTTRDLSLDEAAGGHVLRKHVGRTDDELRERLEQEPNISAASTYTDRANAERTIGSALRESRGKIDRWLGRSGKRPNLVLEYDASQSIGRTLNRGESESRPCAHALVVLKYDPPSGYHVLTSYPECRS